ncbi:MAG TPA: helix-turn-helix domain-containing protein [Terriglobales bacterium]|nr:helix-turn-helix domain-containing protein [Terriglobales bacterium]
MSQRKKVRQQPRYAVEVKDLALARMRAGEKVAVLAAELGCAVCRLYSWRDQWEKHGGQWPELGRRSSRPPPGSGAAREAALERLVGQQQAELDFLREALRLMKQVRRPTAEPDAPSPVSSLRAGRLSRKAG